MAGRDGLNGVKAHGAIVPVTRFDQHPAVALKALEGADKPRKTKIVATLGPASWTAEMIPKMIEAGVDIFRMNCSHRRDGVIEEFYPRLRAEIAKCTSRKIEVLGDLQGPKFRVGETLNDEAVSVAEGEVVEFGIMKDANDITKPGRITMKATIEQVALVKGSSAGETLLIDDGKLAMKVTEKVSESELKCVMLNGGLVKARKGVNAPDVEIDCAALPAKDIEDAEFMLSLDPIPEYFCVSFVQKAADLQELIDIMDRMNIPAEKRPKICPKIEKPQALTNIDSIMALSHSLMIARGDLGVELGHERVPIAQKLLAAAARKAGLEPVICATMMMESMIESPVPTRAEVTDVFNAVVDGCHAVMLSGESATGDYPCEAVKYMGQISKEAEYWLSQE